MVGSSVCLLLLSVLLWPYAASSAIPVDETSVDLAVDPLLPHHYLELDLDEEQVFMSNDTDYHELYKRTQVTVCSGSLLRTFASQSMDAATIIDVSNAMTDQLYTNAQNKDCGTYTGISHQFSWKLFATGTQIDPTACGTTAQKNTINGALQRYFRKVTDPSGYVYGVGCLKLSHGKHLPVILLR